MSTDQAYAGVATLHNGAGEFNRLEFVARQVANKMATTIPVKVVAVETVGGLPRVDVQPLVNQLDGANNSIPHGTIHGLPVEILQAGNSAVILVPKVGDMGMVAFCQVDISSVKKTKKVGNPGSRRKFDWSDGVYRAGVFNGVATQFIKISDDDGITITSADGKPVTINAPGGCTINTSGQDMSIDTGGGKLTASGDVEIGGTLKIGGHDYAAHKHSGVTTGGSNSGAVVP